MLRHIKCRFFSHLCVTEVSWEETKSSFWLYFSRESEDWGSNNGNSANKTKSSFQITREDTVEKYSFNSLIETVDRLSK